MSGPIVLPHDARPKKSVVLAYLAIVVGIFLNFFRAWIWAEGGFHSQAFGYAAGGILLAGAIAYAIAGRKKVRDPNRFAFVFCLVSLFVWLPELSRHRASPQERVSSLVKEAAGTKAQTPDADDLDTLVRDIARDLLEKKRVYEAAAAKFDGTLAGLYSVESYSDKESIQRTMEAVTGILALDQDYTRQIQDVKQSIQDHVDRSSLSATDKQDFMRGVTKSFGDSRLISLKSQATEVEARWADSTLALYNLALLNSGKIRHNHAQLIVKDARLRADFDQRLADSKRLQETLRGLNAEIHQLQQETLKEAGLSLDDLKQSTPAKTTGR